MRNSKQAKVTSKLYDIKSAVWSATTDGRSTQLYIRQTVQPASRAYGVSRLFFIFFIHFHFSYPVCRYTQIDGITFSNFKCSNFPKSIIELMSQSYWGILPYYNCIQLISQSYPDILPYYNNVQPPSPTLPENFFSFFHKEIVQFLCRFRSRKIL